MRIPFFIVVLSVILFWGCEEPVELGIDTKDLVIESRIEAGTSPIVTIRVTNGLGQSVKSENLEESEVFIQLDDEDPITFSLISFSDSSATYTSDCIIQSGSRYTLLIKSPGFRDLRSITDVPDIFTVREITGGDRGPNGGFLPKGNFFDLPIAFDDPEGENNYFHLVVTLIETDSSSESTPRLLTLDYALFPMPQNAKRFNDSGWIFSDDSFKDGVYSGFFRVAKTDVVQFKKPVLTLELRNASVDYFNYHIQNSRPKSEDFPLQGQYSNIDNVAGGTGLFGGYTAKQTTYPLEF